MCMSTQGLRDQGGLPHGTAAAGLAQLGQLKHGIIEVLARQRSNVYLRSVSDKTLVPYVSPTLLLWLGSKHLGNHQTYA